MNRFYWCALQAVIVLTLVGCHADRQCELLDGPNGTIVKLGRRSTIVFLAPTFMNEVMGSEWTEHQLYYSFNRGLDPDGVPLGVVSMSYLPLAKGRATLELSGSEWEELLVTLYSIDTHEVVALRVDLRHGTVQVARPRTVRRGTPIVSNDGRLRFE